MISLIQPTKLKRTDHFSMEAAWPQGARTVHGSLLTALMKSHPQYGALAEVNRALGSKNGGWVQKLEP